jgi:phosphatidylinositol 3-kinase
MIDCLGGPSSAHYSRWKNFCFNAFISLRKSSNLILNLVALMVDSNVRDIQREPDRAMQRVQDRFCLHMKDAEAIRHLDSMLSEGSFISTLVDRAHDLAQMMRT